MSTFLTTSQRLIGVTILALACAACAAPIAEPTPTPTDTPAARPTATPTHMPGPPTLTPTSNVTPTQTAVPPPQIASDAILPATVDRLTGVLVITDQRGTVRAVAVSADGGLVASGGTDWLVRVFDGHTGATLHVLERHRSSVFSLAFSPDGAILVSGGRDGRVLGWDPLSGERLYGMQMAGQVTDLAMSPNGETFAAAALYNAVGNVWQTATGAPLFLLEGHTTRLRSVAYSPDGRWLATGDADGIVIVREAATGQPAFTLSGSMTGEALTLGFSPSGSYLAVGTSRGEIGVWNLETRTLETTWRAHGGEVWSLAYSPDGSLIFSGGSDGGVRISAAQTGEALRTMGRHVGPVRDIALSLDGATLVSGGDDARVIVWRVAP